MKGIYLILSLLRYRVQLRKKREKGLKCPIVVQAVFLNSFIRKSWSKIGGSK